MQINTFMFLEKNQSFLFSFNQHWYFLIARQEVAAGNRIAVLESLKKGVPFLNSAEPSSLNKITSAYYIDEERMAIFNLAKLDEYAIYSMKYERWLNLPQQQLISEEEMTALSSMGALLKVQSTLPGLKRVYYEVYINGKKVMKTPFQIETEIVKIPIGLRAGSCTVQLVRFIAFEDESGKYYKRDRNLYQPEPVTLEVTDKFYYILKLHRSKATDNKPLTISVQPIKKN